MKYLPHKSRRAPRDKGITLLLVMVVLSAILSISVGVFNVLFNQLLISGEIDNSYKALYAADEGIEKILRRDREEHNICVDADENPTTGINCFIQPSVSALSGGCYEGNVSKTDVTTVVAVTGQYPCSATPLPHTVKRRLEVTY